MNSRIKEIIKEEPNGVIAQAYRTSMKAHQGQRRKTGEPYFNHVLATAEQLAEWNLDDAAIAAGLLHDTVEDTSVGEQEILKNFGPEISFLVDGVSKISHIKYRGPETHISARTRVENLRKLIFALGKDLRVIFIKLADRLHNMQTLKALPPQKQKRVALETDEIYAPLAYRLGMQQLSGELRDLAFPYLYPKEHGWLVKNIPERYEERRKYLETLEPQVREALKKHGLEPITIDFRAKRYSSLYQKLLKHEMDVDKVYDLVAMRIIMHNVGECYAVLGIIHQLWPPLPGRIKDYIAMPKPNGYRSLHTTIMAPGNKFLEFQIRTQEMHGEAEYGVAAHWLYEHQKNSKVRHKPRKMAEELDWIQELRKLHDKYSEPQIFMDALKIDFFRTRIFVVTPKGDVLDLPKDSTPVDFAYQIHTEIGNTCIGAKVNGKFVSLNYQLASGDVVEILTQKNKQPSPDWLNFVKTVSSKEKIKAALHSKSGSLKLSRAPTKTDIKLTVEDRIGLLKEISDVIARSHIYIIAIQRTNQPGNKFPSVKIQCEITDKQKIEKLILKLKKIKGVREIGYVLS